MLGFLPAQKIASKIIIQKGAHDLQNSKDHLNLFTSQAHFHQKQMRVSEKYKLKAGQKIRNQN